MSSLAKLQSAKSLDDLAAILGYKPAALAYLLYHLPIAKKYTAFTIPKRDGKPREILAPTPKLKLLQRRLANVLYLAGRACRMALPSICRSSPTQIFTGGDALC